MAPPITLEEQLAIARSMQAEFTPAGQRSRPVHGETPPASRAAHRGPSILRGAGTPRGGTNGTSPRGSSYARGGVASSRDYGSTATGGASFSRGRGGMAAGLSTSGGSMFGGQPGMLGQYFVSAVNTPTATPSKFGQTEANRPQPNSFRPVPTPSQPVESKFNRNNTFPSGSVNDGTAQPSSPRTAWSLPDTNPNTLRTSIAGGNNPNGGFNSGSASEEINSNWGTAPASASVPSWNSTASLAGNNGGQASYQETSKNPWGAPTNEPAPVAHPQEQNNTFTPVTATQSIPAASNSNGNVPAVNHGEVSTRYNPFPMGAFNDGTAFQPSTGSAQVARNASARPAANNFNVNPVQARTRAESVTTHMSSTDPFVAGPRHPFEDPDYPNPNRQPIVTNWGPDPVGPVIPGHLKQTSAMGTIFQIHQETGMAFDELTSDGVSMPARRVVGQPTVVNQPAAASQQPAALNHNVIFAEVMSAAAAGPAISPPAPAVNAVASSSAAISGRQADVSEETFFGGNRGRQTRVTSGGQSSTGTADHMEGVVMDEPPLVPSTGVDGSRVANLNDSIWGPGAHGNAAAPSRVAGPVTATAPAYPPTPAFGAAAPPAATMPPPHLRTVAPTTALPPHLRGAPTTANALPPHLRTGPINRNTTRDSGNSGEKFLGDSMWASW